MKSTQTHAVHSNDVIKRKLSTPCRLIFAGPPDFRGFLVFLWRMADQKSVDLVFA